MARRRVVQGKVEPGATAAKRPTSTDSNGVLAELDAYRKSISLQWFALVSAALHLSCLLVALCGLLRNDYSVAKDERLVVVGFVAYSFDIVTALLLGRSYFYR